MSGTIFTVILTLLGLSAFAGVGIAWLFARRFCAPQAPPAKKSPQDYGMDFESIQYSSQGVPITAWFIPGPETSQQQATIVLAHGWSSNKAQLLPVASALHTAGFACLLYDARSHGDSGYDTPITILKFAQDLRAAIDYLHNRPDVDKARLGVLGHSMGAAAAILAASMDTRIKVLVSSASFADTGAVTKKFMRANHIPVQPLFPLVHYLINRWLGTDMITLAPQNRISEVRIPMLLLHAEADHFIPPDDMQTLRSRAQPAYVSTQLISGGAHHSTIIKDAGYAEYIVAFFDQHLGKAAPAQTLRQPAKHTPQTAHLPY